MEMIRRKLFFFFGAIFLIFLCVTVSHWVRKEMHATILVGGKGSEGEILSEILALLLERDLGISVKRQNQFEGTSLMFQAMKDRQVDLYVEYTGTVFTTILGKKVGKKCPEEIYQEVKEGLKEWGIEALSPLGFQNQYALMMHPEVAKKFQIVTLSDLASKGESLKIGLDQEFYGREEFEILKKKYHFPLNHIKLMDHILLYLTLNKGGCDLINGYSTDGFCSGLRILKDDKKYFPSYEAIPIIRKEILVKYKGIEKVIGKLTGSISTELMQKMNYEVEQKGETVYNVAQTFLSTMH